jgi:bifunctional DNA-binding transcriptional regulator/antitoxin component of YhaV-PrlF toxin-antitoxin module
MVLPSALRRALGVERGGRLVMLATDDGVELTTAQRARRRAQERFRRLVPEGESVVDEFLAEERAEVAHEDADETMDDLGLAVHAPTCEIALDAGAMMAVTKPEGQETVAEPASLWPVIQACRQ